ncbi:MAG: alkaline phosphatase D, partial [Myxococcota bacterium]
GEKYFPQSLASGDPKPASVVLWTRVWDTDAGDSVDLRLQVALDVDFEQLVTLDGGSEMVLTAKKASDFCVKVILGSLTAATTYYYRFIHTRGEIEYTTRTGRTRTAPEADADVPVRFAFASCQDYSGHYFNTYRRLLQLDDLDFVVHLGDYIYETTDNPSFQDSSPDRSVSFTNTTGAIAFNVGTEEEYFAARSVAQYRELYQLYRADKDLQAVHELYPMVIIWDDHEFSDDSHGATATYFAGEKDETDVSRRKSANQAWFEYMPIDFRTPDFQYDSSVEYPNDISIYRDFRFGKHVHLVMTDLRSYRDDHLIDEAAFPGEVAVTEAELTAIVGSVPDGTPAYVDIDTHAGGDYKSALATLTTSGGFEEADLAGLVAIDFINTQVSVFNETAETPLDLIEPDGLDRGFAFMHMGKRGHYSSLGSRYLIVKDTFDVYAAKRFSESSGTAQSMMGDDQEAWFLKTMKESTATWKLWGNEFLLMPLQVDLSNFATLPEEFRRRFYLLADDWTGFQNRRNQIIGELSEVDNVVALTGDIHAFFAGNPTDMRDTSKRIVELVTAGISSNSLKQLLLRTALSDQTLADAGAAALAAGVKGLLLDQIAKPNPHLGYADPTAQGFVVVNVGAQTLEAEFHRISEEFVKTHLGDVLEDKFEVEHFKVEAGAYDLYWMVDGVWKRWDPSTVAWV